MDCPAQQKGCRAEVSNVCVAVRCRPLSGAELLKSDQTVVDVCSSSQLLLRHKSGETSYNFDHVFSSDTPQDHVFETLGVPQLDKAFDGFSSTILAYGQTGSGKTHTMSNHLGGADQRGLIPRIGEGLFDRIAKLTEEHKTRRFLVLCTFFEIYNEVIYDLLAPPGKHAKRGGLEVKEQKGIGIYVKDLTEVVVEDANALWKCLEQGFNSRATSATKMNGASSRSHCVFTVVLHQKDSDDSSHSTVSKVNLVDLAGSERCKPDDADWARSAEGVNINKSLSALGNVINALSSMASGKKNVLVPYRDSKLTRVLQESFGGNSLCTMIATVSPSSTAVDETFATFNFARRAKAIRVIATKNDESLRVKQLEQEVQMLRQLEQQSAEEDGARDNLGSAADRKAQIETLETFMQQSWEDKQRLSRQYEEERRRAAEEAQRAADQVQNEHRRRLHMLAEHGDLQLSLQAVKSLDSEQRYLSRVASVISAGQQLRSQMRAAKLYRESAHTDLSAFSACCDNPAAALALLGQARAKLEALTVELDGVQSCEARYWEQMAQATPELAVALHDLQIQSAASTVLPGAESQLPALVGLVQDQFFEHCFKEVATMRDEANQFMFHQELEKIHMCLTDALHDAFSASPLQNELSAAMLGERGQGQTDQLPGLLGLCTYDLDNELITASSSAAAAPCARLLRSSRFGGWSPSTDSPEEYLEVSCGMGPRVVAGLSVQGRVPCTGRWEQTREMLELALGLDAECLQHAQPKTFMRPPVRFVHEASLELWRKRRSFESSTTGWDVPPEFFNFVDMPREQRAEYFQLLIQQTNSALVGFGSEVPCVALQLSSQDITSGKNCKETNRMLQMLSYLALRADPSCPLQGGLADIAPQWTSGLKIAFFTESEGWQWIGSPHGRSANEATIFKANTDADSVCFISLPHVEAVKLRLHPVDWHRHAALRCEVHVVRFADGGGTNGRATDALKANVGLVTRCIKELQIALDRQQEELKRSSALMTEKEQQERCDLEKQLADARARIEYLEERAASAENRLLREQAENERLGAKVEQITTELASKQPVHPVADTPHHDTQSMPSELQEQMDELKEQLLVMTDERDVARGHAHELFGALSCREEDLANANKAREALMEKLERHLLSSKSESETHEELGRLSGRLQGLQEAHDAALQRSEVLQREVMRLSLENQNLAAEKERLVRKADKLVQKRETYKEKFCESEQKRRMLVEGTDKLKEKCEQVLEKMSNTPPKTTPRGARSNDARSSKSSTPSKASPTGKGHSQMARASRATTLGRNPGIPVSQWMQPEEYGRHLGLSAEVPGSIDSVILDALQPVLCLELPIPWEVHLSGEHLYFAHSGFEPAQTSWEHPMKRLHVEMVEAVRRAASIRGSGEPTQADAAAELRELAQQIVGRDGLSGFGIWEPVRGWSKAFHDMYSDACVVQYQDRKSGQRRIDDPRLAVASYMGLALTGLRIVWDRFVGDTTTADDEATQQLEGFPFGEDEMWSVAEQLGTSVLREPHRSSSSRNLLAPD